MLSDLLHWYVTMLRGSIPKAIEARVSGTHRGIVVAVSPCGGAEEAMVSTLKHGREHRLGRLGVLLAEGTLPQGGPATIRLPPGEPAILERETVLPLAVERSLATALAHEMDRLTPFDAQEVLWHAEIRRRDREAGTLRLGLAILPRRRIGDLLDRLARTRLAVVAVEGETGSGRRTIPLGSARQARRGARVLGYACAALALACLLIPPLRQQVALDHRTAEMAALAPALHRVEAIRARLAFDTTGRKALDAERGKASAALRALDEITRALPDGSFLTDLSFRDRVATLDGLSPDAARLIARFAADPDFADPAFTAPVTRSLDAKADMFVIRVRLRAGAG